ncbi:50S ribosomal protein L5 [Patescibacteria group bacterium]|nr:MAG: 50S ribosomal protein L5 [Patescibacteria group bacterium]
MALKEHYKTVAIPALRQAFGYKNVHAVPAITKVTLNVGLSKGLKDAKFLETAESTLRRITGQQPVKTKARISISNFKIREGMVIGMKVTLRGARMWDFLEKLIKVSIPRMRDFRGLPERGFDGQGNYTMGFKEHIAFPEIRSDEIEVVHGLQVTIGTSAKTKPEALALLKALGMPIEEKNA